MNKFGYVYVASCNQAYYKAAVDSAISLRDNYPKAQITLFTHEKFIQDKDRKFFDSVQTGIPINKRAKMWGMARSPYEKTLYLDCDTEIRSDKIKDVFDILEDNDIMFTKIIPHVSADKVIDANNNLEYHGGIILYNNRPLTNQLVHDWYSYYQHQVKSDWPNSIFSEFNPKMQQWDQFTMWYLLHQVKKYDTIKHKMFPDGGTSYNYIFLLEDELNPRNAPYKDLEQIIYHYTIPKVRQQNALVLKAESGSSEDFN